jgi:hypothetical protein
VDEFYDGKGGRFAVTRSLEPGAKLFQIENDESGSVLATTVNRAAAVEMANSWRKCRSRSSRLSKRVVPLPLAEFMLGVEC